MRFDILMEFLHRSGEFIRGLFVRLKSFLPFVLKLAVSLSCGLQGQVRKVRMAFVQSLTSLTEASACGD